MINDGFPDMVIVENKKMLVKVPWRYSFFFSAFSVDNSVGVLPCVVMHFEQLHVMKEPWGGRQDAQGLAFVTN